MDGPSVVERRIICPPNNEKGKMTNFTSFSKYLALKSLVKISELFLFAFLRSCDGLTEKLDYVLFFNLVA